jgi:DNA primase
MSQRTIADLKRDVLIPQVLASANVAPLRRVGRQTRGPCPICNAGRNPRSRGFAVSPDGRQWYCFGACARGGTVIDLMMELHGLAVGDAIRRLQQF